MVLVLQQPEHRVTSTQGGQMRKFAAVGSTWERGISYTSVRVLHVAGTASSTLTETYTDLLYTRGYAKIQNHQGWGSQSALYEVDPGESTVY